MNPADFRPSLDRLFRIVRRTARTASGEGVYTEVETNLDQGTYAHDDRNGTEVIFTSNRGDFHVLRVSRPEPKVELVPVRVGL